MAKILVSLVSDQTIPTILLARELKDVDFHIFVSTDLMEKRDKTKHLVNALGLKANQFKMITVIEDSLTDVKNKLEKEVNFYDSKFCINLTGGTKLMSIGLFNFFSNRDSDIYYIPGGKNVYMQIYPESEQKSIDLNYRTNLFEYLTAYGISIAEKNYQKKNKLLKDKQYTKEIFEKYISEQIDLGFLDELRKIRGSIKKLAIADFEGLQEFFSSINFVTSESGTINKTEIDYLTGGWFEEYTYTLITEQLNLQPDMIGINISISNQNVNNEFDVMYMYNNNLHVVECKTGVFDSISSKNITNEAIYKLAALKKDFGLFARSIFYTLSEKGNEMHQIKNVYMERANILGIKIIDKIEIIENSNH